MLLPYAIIFASGAATLALELLASRVMTPYFGVSLYIWSGILSITLVALALGYWAGGRLATGLARSQRSERLYTVFLLMPALSALALVIACLLYPHVFPLLARQDLVAGAFIACLLLLGVPLVTTSAMNPLLIAWQLHRRAAPGQPADAGAGRVFFTSTVGSVAGVIVTAFWLIQSFSNFVSLLIVALCLALLPVIALRPGARPIEGRRALAATTAIAVLAAAGMLWHADAYLGRMWPVKYSGLDWTVEASVTSLFGTVKVLKSTPVDDRGRFIRVYFQDGLFQNRMLSDGQSFSFYTYALEGLALAHRPDMRSALVLGLGAGVVPARLAARGIDVTAVEIDPASFAVAKRFFGLDEAKVNAVQADARTYLRGCRGKHDVVVVDLFHGDGTPAYLITRNFFADLRACLAPGGVAIFNTFADLELPLGYAHFLSTLRSEFGYVTLYREDERDARHINSYVVAAQAATQAERIVLRRVPPGYAAALERLLASPRQLDRALTAGGQIITDARSTVADDIARIQMGYRRQVVRDLPPAFLVN
ncbi:MAG: fused MFS/spermidine synthase [Burkholderiales bacterium]|nr:fused MFS/spermidine synthase [Burkholderiales bacterium]